MQTLAELFGNNPMQCPHEKMISYTRIVVPSEEEDFAYIKAKLLESVPGIEHATAVKICDDCYEDLPSYKRQREADRLHSIAMREAEDEELLEFARRRIGGELLFQCTTCDRILEEADVVPIRECPHCESNFDASDGRNCPDCNRPFTRKVTDAGCPDCLEEDGVVEWEVSDELKSRI